MGTSRDQVHRLLALVPYLQSRQEISVTEVADLFEVPPRTIVRDLHVLLYCGWPGLGMGDLIEVDLEALEGEGVIRLSNADFLARPLRLTSTEAAALVVALRTLREGSSPQEASAVDRALAKIEHAAGESARVASQVQVELPSDAAARAHLPALSDALARGRQVRLRHHSTVRDEVTERVVDPIALASAEGHHYLDAWCHRAEDRRLFRVDRITEVQILDDPVTPGSRAPALDLSEGIFRPSADTPTATLRLTPEARWVTEYYPTVSVQELPAGALRVRLHVSDPAWLVALMLRLGGSATVEEPAHLAAAAREAARAALAQYPE